MKYGMFADPGPGVVRLSSCLRRCREQGLTEAAAEVKRVANQFHDCPVHGRMADPIVGIVGTQIAIVCPHCSGADVLAMWEAEGKQALA